MKNENCVFIIRCLDAYIPFPCFSIFFPSLNNQVTPIFFFFFNLNENNQGTNLLLLVHLGQAMMYINLASEDLIFSILSSHGRKVAALFDTCVWLIYSI